MSTITHIKDTLTGELLEQIEELAAQNYGPTDICFKLNQDKRSFLRLWRDTKSQVREAYERGRMEIEITKRQKLNEDIESGSITAIQIHDKRAEEQRFEDIKREIFSFE